MTGVLESVIIKSTKNKGDEIHEKKGILKWLYIACLITLVATVSFIIGVMCYIIWGWSKMKFETMISIVNFCAGFVVSYFTDFSMMAMIIYVVCYLILSKFVEGC